MGFFDNLGKKASDAYKVTADKTGKLAKEAKLRMKMGELKGQINSIYEEIGKVVYENHTKEGKGSIKKVLEEKCTQIDVLADEIKEMEKECMELKDKKECPKCFEEMDKNVKFCPHCGEAQEIPEEKVVEAEIVEEVKDQKVEEKATTKEKKVSKENKDKKDNK